MVSKLNQIPEAILPQCQALTSELLRWNRRMNLTGHKDAQSVQNDLILDGLALAPHILGPSLLDIGSGAGFPGLVLALALPDIAVTLLEPREKRVSWLKHAVRVLELGDRVSVVRGRSPQALGGQQFQTITLRAVSGLETSLELAKPYQAAGSRVVLPRALKDQDQAQGLGLQTHIYTLPEPYGRRMVAVWLS